jgi:hypothetical protein
MMTSKEKRSAGRKTCLSVTFMHHICLMDCHGIQPETTTLKMDAAHSSETLVHTFQPNYMASHPSEQ